MHSREVLKELCLRDRQTSTLFKMLTLICFVLHKESNSFSNQHRGNRFFGKKYWYCKCKLLIVSLHSLFKASSPKRHCSRIFKLLRKGPIHSTDNVVVETTDQDIRDNYNGIKGIVAKDRKRCKKKNKQKLAVMAVKLSANIPF